MKKFEKFSIFHLTIFHLWRRSPFGLAFAALRAAKWIKTQQETVFTTSQSRFTTSAGLLNQPPLRKLGVLCCAKTQQNDPISRMKGGERSCPGSPWGTPGQAGTGRGQSVPDPSGTPWAWDSDPLVADLTNSFRVRKFENPNFRTRIFAKNSYRIFEHFRPYFIEDFVKNFTLFLGEIFFLTCKHVFSGKFWHDQLPIKMV